jgi:hypothetical protein
MPLRKRRKTALVIFMSVLILVIVLSFGTDLLTKKIRGIVTNGKSNLQFAKVKIKAVNNSSKTDYYGNFSLDVNDGIDSLIVAAWAEGYYNGDTKALPGDSGITIRLNKLPDKDNTNYRFISPFSSEGDVLNCQNCHSEVLMNQYKKDAHSQSALNPFFLAMYYGTNYNGDNGFGIGFKKDFPDSFGNCATCHIPGAAIDNPYGVDPKSVTNPNTNGISCDVCHKIKNVIPNSGQGTTGTLSIEFLRPPEGKHVFFGPYIDVREPDVYSPIISKSEYCMPCHNAKFWGVPTYQSFNEWNESIYPSLNIQCQTCHMAPDGILTNFAPGKGGVERDPLTIPSHSQPGSRDTTILKNSVTLTLSATLEGDFIKVKVVIFNDKTGHHVPSDSPSRNMILLVEAKDDLNNNLEFISGEKVPFWGGKGGVAQGNYSGLPGKGFAKILQDFVGNMPSPHWRPTYIVSDNRIKAMGSDTSVYIFRKPVNYSKIRITSKLIYRRFYKEWMDEKGFEIPDILMKNQSVELTPVSTSVTEQKNNDFYVSQNSPNPFRSHTRFNISLPYDSNIGIKIFNLKGQLMLSEEKKNLLQGQNFITLNLSELSSGIYYCTFSNRKSIIANRKIVKYGN